MAANFPLASGYRKIGYIARWEGAPTQHDREAGFVSNDHRTTAVMDTLCNKLKLRIPQDVSVLEYDDAATASWPAYHLTIVRQPANKMVHAPV